MPFPRQWHLGAPPGSWEACLGLGPDGRPSAKAREAAAVRLHARAVGSGPYLLDPRTQTPPAKDDASRLEALCGTELAAATLRDSPWAALLPDGGGRPGQLREATFAERVHAVLGLTPEAAADQVRPLIELFDDASLGLTDIGRAGFPLAVWAPI